MSYQYFVIVDSAGHAGLAATNRLVVDEEAASNPGVRVFAVQAANAFQARRLALEEWNGAAA